ncbi:hypothetical protein EV426DRAFT_578661 [Tirmania nivea]|nr:hypothetical protein EV426DRAFT_578661 [Tirmania nivea]
MTKMSARLVRIINLLKRDVRRGEEEGEADIYIQKDRPSSPTSTDTEPFLKCRESRLCTFRQHYRTDSTDLRRHRIDSTDTEQIPKCQESRTIVLVDLGNGVEDTTAFFHIGPLIVTQDVPAYYSNYQLRGQYDLYRLVSGVEDCGVGFVAAVWDFGFQCNLDQQTSGANRPTRLLKDKLNIPRCEGVPTYARSVKKIGDVCPERFTISGYGYRAREGAGVNGPFQSFNSIVVIHWDADHINGIRDLIQEDLKEQARKKFIAAKKPPTQAALDTFYWNATDSNTSKQPRFRGSGTIPVDKSHVSEWSWDGTSEYVDSTQWVNVTVGTITICRVKVKFAKLNKSKKMIGYNFFTNNLLNTNSANATSPLEVSRSGGRGFEGGTWEEVLGIRGNSGDGKQAATGSGAQGDVKVAAIIGKTTGAKQSSIAAMIIWLDASNAVVSTILAETWERRWKSNCFDGRTKLSTPIDCLLCGAWEILVLLPAYIQWRPTASPGATSIPRLLCTNYPMYVFGFDVEFGHRDAWGVAKLDLDAFYKQVLQTDSKSPAAVTLRGELNGGEFKEATVLTGSPDPNAEVPEDKVINPAKAQVYARPMGLVNPMR